ncbi:MAG: PAS domain S-box protein, partial [Bacteroidota bacterium]
MRTKSKKKGHKSEMTGPIRPQIGFQEFLESVPDAMVIINDHGKIVFLNAQTEKLFGYSREELLGHEVEVLIPERLRSKHPKNRARYFTKPRVRPMGAGMVLCGLRKNGSELSLEISLSPLETEMGVFVVSAIRDITERRRSEGALKKSEARLAEAQRIAHLGNWDWDMARNELWWSDEIYRVFGLTPQQFGATYDAFLNSVHPDDREFVKRSVDEALYDRKPYSIDHRIVLPDGSERIVHEHAQVTFDEAGKPIRMIGTVQDITDRKHAEEQLRKLSQAVEFSPSSIIITDSDGTIEYVNPKFTEVSGYAFDEVVGKNPRILKSGNWSPEKYKQLWETITSGKVWRGEFENKKKNGELFWESTSISPITSAEGVITHFIAIKEDITEKKKLEAQVLRMQRMESIGTLAGGIAHDLNNVLAPILMSTQILKRK